MRTVYDRTSPEPRTHAQRMAAARGIKLSVNAGQGLRSTQQQRRDIVAAQDQQHEATLDHLDVPSWVSQGSPAPSRASEDR